MVGHGWTRRFTERAAEIRIFRYDVYLNSKPQNSRPSQNKSTFTSSPRVRPSRQARGEHALSAHHEQRLQTRCETETIKQSARISHATASSRCVGAGGKEREPRIIYLFFERPREIPAPSLPLLYGLRWWCVRLRLPPTKRLWCTPSRVRFFYRAFPGRLYKKQ